MELSGIQRILPAAALVSAVALAGCGGSTAKSGGPAAGAGTSAASSGTASSASSTAGSASSPSTFSSGAGAGSSTSTGAATKTCSAGYTQAAINGKGKCLAAGQTCSAKAVSQYPQYGFVCTTTNGKLVLRRK